MWWNGPTATKMAAAQPAACRSPTRSRGLEGRPGAPSAAEGLEGDHSGHGGSWRGETPSPSQTHHRSPVSRSGLLRHSSQQVLGRGQVICAGGTTSGAENGPRRACRGPSGQQPHERGPGPRLHRLSCCCCCCCRCYVRHVVGHGFEQGYVCGLCCGRKSGPRVPTACPDHGDSRGLVGTCCTRHPSPPPLLQLSTSRGVASGH